MKCERYRRLLSKKLDGEASVSELADLDLHLVKCEDCRIFGEALERMHAAHLAAMAEEPAVSVADAVLESLQAKGADGMRGLMRWVLPAAAAAVILFGFIMGDFLVSAFLSPRDSAPVELADLAYLDPYPPQSVGEMISAQEEVETDEQR